MTSGRLFSRADMYPDLPEAAPVEAALDALRQMLNDPRASFADVLFVRAQATALCQDLAEVKLRTERRIGQLL